MNTKVGNPLRKLVLIKLADNANDSGECWPSYQHIADQCEISTRSVIRHIDALCEAGLLQKQHRPGPKGNSSNLYQITLRGDRESLWVVTQCHKGGDRESLGGSDRESPRTSNSLEPVNEPFRDQQAESHFGHRIDYQAITVAFNNHLPALPQPRDMTEKRKKAIRSIVKRGGRYAEPDFFSRFFAYVSKSDFLMGRGAKPWRGCCFDWLLKPENFQKIIEGNYHPEDDNA